jgi:hypothetical protein
MCFFEDFFDFFELLRLELLRLGAPPFLECFLLTLPPDLRLCLRETLPPWLRVARGAPPWLAFLDDFLSADTSILN